MVYQASGLPRNKLPQKFITLTVNRWKDKNNNPDGNPANQNLFALFLDFSHQVFNEKSGTVEIERHKSRENAQQGIVRQVVHIIHFIEMDGKQHSVSHKEVGHGCPRNRRDKNGNQAGHSKVDHQDFQRKDRGSNGRLENTCQGPAGTRTHQNDNRFPAHLEFSPEERADGASGQYNRRFKTHRASKSNGEHTGNHRRIKIVRPQFAKTFRNGMQHNANTVRKVSLYHIFGKQNGKR